MRIEKAEVVITGAGPSGAVAAGLLRKAGHEVLILEKETFPRFSIGESLLPHSMTYIEEAGMLQDVVEAGFQHKNGASFCWDGKLTDFDFRDKFTQGWGSTYQVQRAKFDHVLAKAAERMGATIRYRHEVTAVDVHPTSPTVTVKSDTGEVYQVKTNFVLDASGFGRVLPRLLNLERPSNFPVREAMFTHIEDRIPTKSSFDRNKIRITVHPKNVDVWFWLIPFSDGRCSLGVVGEGRLFERLTGDHGDKLKTLVSEEPTLRELLKDAVWDTPVRQIKGYAANVTSTNGPGYALLGNAGEFLDPVFSSGVTIAFTSASLAVKALKRQLKGEQVDWNRDYSMPLREGVDAFRAFVEAWYQGGFQKIIFYEKQQPEIRRMICSILAGYAWDKNNPYVAEPRRVKVLEEVCSQ